MHTYIYIYSCIQIHLIYIYVLLSFKPPPPNPSPHLVHKRLPEMRSTKVVAVASLKDGLHKWQDLHNSHHLRPPNALYHLKLMLMALALPLVDKISQFVEKSVVQIRKSSANPEPSARPGNCYFRCFSCKGFGILIYPNQSKFRCWTSL